MTRAETNGVYTALTSDTGDYPFRAPISANYELNLTMPGFKRNLRSGRTAQPRRIWTEAPHSRMASESRGFGWCSRNQRWWFPADWLSR